MIKRFTKVLAVTALVGVMTLCSGCVFDEQEWQEYQEYLGKVNEYYDEQHPGRDNSHINIEVKIVEYEDYLNSASAE